MELMEHRVQSTPSQHLARLLLRSHPASGLPPRQAVASKVQVPPAEAPPCLHASQPPQPAVVGLPEKVTRRCILVPPPNIRSVACTKQRVCEDTTMTAHIPVKQTIDKIMDNSNAAGLGGTGWIEELLLVKVATHMQDRWNERRARGTAEQLAPEHAQNLASVLATAPTTHS